MKNYWSITLLNVDYKIITKTLSIRFSKVLEEVVGPYQHAFTPGRRATNCAMALNLIFENLKENNMSGLVLSLDMEKAYDRVYHGWLFKVLDSLEAGPNITKWIKAIYSNVQATCMVNGFYSDPVDTKRGCTKLLFIHPLNDFFHSYYY